MNAYNIYNEEHYSTILYHAIARDEEQVRELAEEAGISLEGLTIDLERMNVKDQLGRQYSAKIEDALVR
ncbi:hypothetical protein [Bacteroides acidifaciens]|jgi:hypothetical protein|uniref:hypothetical protein n=1 Tax=Bacteroides acidifaciens TaxID=85831 RepID=UPI002592B748|nr:hypothetical protein [Bacteroides acidifaciens]